jgi:hypothetical protein
MRIDPDDSAPDNQTDGRRARLADVQRLESALAEASARLKAIEEFVSNRDNAPISRSQFYAQIYAMSALVNKRPQFIRDWADLAWSGYQDALNNKPRMTIQEVYGEKAPEPNMPSNESAGC